MGITVNVDQFAEDCKEAQEAPAKENSFRRYRLNQWTEQDVRWLDMEKWAACGGITAVPQARGEHDLLELGHAREPLKTSMTP